MPGRRRREPQVVVPAALPALAANQLRYDQEDRLETMTSSRAQARVVDRREPLVRPRMHSTVGSK